MNPIEKPCGTLHGLEVVGSTADPENPFIPIPGPCPECGATL